RRWFMESFHGLVAAHWDHEPRRSGVSGERRWKWFRGLAALCRDAATERRFMESLHPLPHMHWDHDPERRSKLLPLLFGRRGPGRGGPLSVFGLKALRFLS